ncbi:MAG: ATP-binding cassette domain-containing protein, partial [Filifactoraceae bacterium]
ICSLKKDISYKWKPYKDKDLECKAGSCESKEVENKLMCISMKEIIFSYPSSDSYVLRRFTASLWRRGINCLIGGNGSGKSTLLKIIAGIQKGYMGKLSLPSQSVGYLPQNINSFFSSDTVYNEITFLGYDHDYYLYLMNELKILDLEQRHPFDVSGGEAVRICIAAILLRRPKFILLDEPTRGLDSYLKDILASLLNDSGAVIFMATHDLEFAARYGKRCFMLFDGELTLEEEPHIFFKNNHYYTTSISKGFRHVCADLVTMEDVRNL